MMLRLVHRHRGMSLIELMLALVVTALVAGAIAGMLSAVSTAFATREDGRSLMIRANLAQARLAGYIEPARCVLESSPTGMVIWLNDDRESGTIHATELRWLRYDDSRGVIEVEFIDLSNLVSQHLRDLTDQEYTSDVDWDIILQAWRSKGFTRVIEIVDGLGDAAVSTDTLDDDARQAGFDLEFLTEAGRQDVRVTATVRQLQMPLR